MRVAADDNTAALAELVTDDAGWSRLERRQSGATPILGGGEAEFIDALRAATSRFSAGAPLVCPPSARPLEDYVDSGAEPMGCFVLSRDALDVLTFTAVTRGGVAKIAHVGLFVARPAAPWAWADTIPLAPPPRSDADPGRPYPTGRSDRADLLEASRTGYASSAAAISPIVESECCFDTQAMGEGGYLHIEVQCSGSAPYLGWLSARTTSNLPRSIVDIQIDYPAPGQLAHAPDPDRRATCRYHYDKDVQLYLCDEEAAVFYTIAAESSFEWRGLKSILDGGVATVSAIDGPLTGLVCSVRRVDVPCPAPQVDCRARCVDLASDERNCGACRSACVTDIPGALSLCEAGTCIIHRVTDSLPDNRERLFRRWITRHATPNLCAEGDEACMCREWAALTCSQKGAFLTITHRLNTSRLAAYVDPERRPLLDHVTDLYAISPHWQGAPIIPCGGNGNRLFMSADPALHRAFAEANAVGFSTFETDGVPDWHASEDLAGPHAPFTMSDETQYGHPRGQNHFWAPNTPVCPPSPWPPFMISGCFQQVCKPEFRQCILDRAMFEIDQDYNWIHDSNTECYYPRGLGGVESGREKYARNHGAIAGVRAGPDYDWAPAGCPRPRCGGCTTCGSY